MHFSSIDVVRHPLVQRIIDAYEKDEKEKLELPKKEEDTNKAKVDTNEA